MVFLLLDVFRVFGSGFFLPGVFLPGLFVFSWASLGIVISYFVLPTPPPSVEAGLGNRATDCGTGRVSKVVAWVFGVVLGVFRVTFLLVFGIHFSLFQASSSPPSPVAGGTAMAFVDDFFLPLKAQSSFHFFVRIMPVSLPCRSEGWERILRRHILDSCSSSCNRGFHDFPIILHIRLIRVG